jgi:hypothetical protein
MLRFVGDAVADALETAEFLDVDVDQLAGVITLVAADRLGGLERLDAIETETLEDAAEVAGEMPTWADHQGRWCFGKTPMQTFLDAKPIAEEKMIAA